MTDNFTAMSCESHGQCFCAVGVHCDGGPDCNGPEDHNTEPLDLDAIEADLADPEVAAYFQTLARDEAEEPGTLSAIGRVTAAAPGLLARVRTAEADRDEAQGALNDQALDVAYSAIETQKSLGLAWMKVAQKAERERDEALAALASRTVETAEEWEHGLDLGSFFGIVTLAWIEQHQEFEVRPGHQEVRRRPAGKWEPTPPTPETEEKNR